MAVNQRLRLCVHWRIRLLVSCSVANREVVAVIQLILAVNQLVGLHIFQTNLLHMLAMWTAFLWVTSLAVLWFLVEMTRRWICGQLENRLVFWWVPDFQLCVRIRVRFSYSGYLCQMQSPMQFDVVISHTLFFIVVACVICLLYFLQFFKKHSSYF